MLIPFQGRLTNPQGVAYTNGQYTIIFNLYDQAVGGTLLWSETHQKVGVINGMVNVFLGSINSLTNVDFSQTRHLGITIDADNNPNTPDPEMVPRQMIIPAFWAKQAENSAKLAGYDWSAILVSGTNPATGLIRGDKLQDGAINTARILDGSITASKLDPQMVWSNVISGGAIVSKSGFYDCGDGSEGDAVISTNIDGEHLFGNLTITNTISVGPLHWLILRVRGTFTFGGTVNGTGMGGSGGVGGATVTSNPTVGNAGTSGANGFGLGGSGGSGGSGGGRDTILTGSGGAGGSVTSPFAPFLWPALAGGLGVPGVTPPANSGASGTIGNRGLTAQTNSAMAIAALRQVRILTFGLYGAGGGGGGSGGTGSGVGWGYSGGSGGNGGAGVVIVAAKLRMLGPSRIETKGMPGGAGAGGGANYSTGGAGGGGGGGGGIAVYYRDLEGYVTNLSVDASGGTGGVGGNGNHLETGGSGGDGGNGVVAIRQLN